MRRIFVSCRRSKRIQLEYLVYIVSSSCNQQDITEMPKCNNTNGVKLSFNIRFCGGSREVMEEIVERSCVDEGDIAPLTYGCPVVFPTDQWRRVCTVFSGEW
ncbi:hypothetical protein QVD17_31485 [Tagetes erecta]|uniref:Uncharacterized protein n=1 Tax=Tagetes erecta TaxID=13708 RepID=A0AAD8K3H5_TARER|nr:hypothetical protein QVD17_31485 [Tagetes erecta]